MRPSKSTLIAAAALAMSGGLHTHDVKRVNAPPPHRRLPPVRNTPEIEAWNRAVEQRKAEKKAKRGHRK